MDGAAGSRLRHHKSPRLPPWKNILHCDLKAENILIDHLGKAKIADFGTAQFKGKFSFPWGGSPAYWAPELIPWIQKLPRSEISMQFPEAFKKPLQGKFPPFTEASDTYALGTLLWEIAEQYSASTYILYEDRILSLEGIPQIYSKWIQECRAQNPEKRPLLKNLSQELSDPKNQQKLLEFINQRLALTQIVSEETFSSSVMLSLEKLILFPFPEINVSNNFTKPLEELVKTFENPSQKWELLASRLLKNPNYFSQMAFQQQHLLQNLILAYGQKNFGNEKWQEFEHYILCEGKWDKKTKAYWHLGLAEIRI